MHRSITLLLILVFLTASSIATPLPVKARPLTIVVPDDYATIQDAINAADEGATIFVRKGTYEYPENQTLTIEKTLSLKGEDPDSTILNLHPPWVPTGRFCVPSGGIPSGGTLLEPVYEYDEPIKILASNVTFSGFTITSNAGRFYVAGESNQIIDNIIMIELCVTGCYQNIAQNTVIVGIGARAIGCYGSFNTIAENRIVGKGGEGIVIGGSSSNKIHNNTVTDSNCGIGLYDCAPYAVNDNAVFYNTVKNCSTGLGVTLSSNSINNIFYANTLACNNIGLSSKSKVSNSTFYHNNFISNVAQVWTGYESVYFATDNFDNGAEGNYWSDYNGTDSKNDGLGDTPYIIDDNRQDYYPLMAPFDIDSVMTELPDWASPEPQQTESFPTTLAVAIASVAVFGLGIAVYFVQFKKKASKT
jgi:parallel beta-helix repeat protein